MAALVAGRVEHRGALQARRYGSTQSAVGVLLEMRHARPGRSRQWWWSSDPPDHSVRPLIGNATSRHNDDELDRVIPGAPASAVFHAAYRCRTAVWLAYEQTELSLRNRIVTCRTHVRPAANRRSCTGVLRSARRGRVAVLADRRFGSTLRAWPTTPASQPRPSRAEAIVAHAEQSISEDADRRRGARARRRRPAQAPSRPAVGALLSVLAKLSGAQGRRRGRHRCGRQRAVAAVRACARTAC